MELPNSISHGQKDGHTRGVFLYSDRSNGGAVGCQPEVDRAVESQPGKVR